MDPVLLTFTNAALEKAYDRHSARYGALQNDKTSLHMMLLLFVVAVARYVVVMNGPALVFASLGAWYTAWEVTYRRRAAFEEVVERRIQLVLFTRLGGLIAQCCYTFLDQGTSTNIFGLMLSSGIIPSMIFVFNMKLKFKHHLPCHVVSTFTLLCLVMKSSCLAVLEADEHHAIVRMANFMDLIAKQVMFTRGVEFNDTHLLCPCLHVTVWFHAFLLLIGGLYIIWITERRSRVAFIEVLPKELRVSEKLESITQFPMWIVAIHLGILANIFGVTWMLNYSVVRMVDSWGLALAKCAMNKT